MTRTTSHANWIRRAPRRWEWALAITGLVVAAVLAWRLAFRDSSKPVSVSEAVSDYRSTKPSDPPRSGTAGPDPAPGVYVFRTEGAERIADTPLGSTEHLYPVRTAVVVGREGCGFAEQWVPLSGRSRTLLLCRGSGGWTMRRAVDTRTFFSIEATREYACGEGALQAPLRTSRQLSWTSMCTASGFSNFAETARSRLLGRETLTVGSRRVPAFHVRDEVQQTGGTRGRAVRDTWRRATDGLLLRLEYREESVMSTHVGDVRLGDRYELELTSLTPRR
jgi:hypothetical protein